jgi:putative serine protease PepD
VPPALAGPGKPPRRFRKGAVALSITAVLAAGAVGGVTGALVGSADNSTVIPNSSTPISQNVGNNTPSDVSGIAAKVLPSVVQVNVQTATAQGIGSGVILTADGRILTNNHVVSGAQQVQVVLNDGRKFDATVVGTDAASDLAVLQLKGASGLTPATLGDSSTVKIGDEVVAFGSPGGLQGTVTSGIVSALDRPVNVGSEQQSPNPYTRNGNGGGQTTSYKAIQTDASINQGNSGGALVNADGQVIGINSAIYSPVSSPDGSAGSVGIGFAIPINTAKTVINQIVANG